MESKNGNMSQFIMEPLPLGAAQLSKIPRKVEPTSLLTSGFIFKTLYIVQKRLGSGAFGVVYKVEEESSSKVYALKDILCLNDKQLKSAICEVQTMKKLSHENVISVLKAAQMIDSLRKNHMVILTEYCAGGNLNERLNQESTDEMNLKWMRQTAAGLAYLHSQKPKVVHRDLKTENVLLTATPAEDVKLADFGLAREYAALKSDAARKDDESLKNHYTKYYMNSVVGTPYWMAPEVFHSHYTEKSDVFSLGILFFAILERDFVGNGKKAFYGAFKRIPGKGKVPIGFAMAKHNRHITIQFSPNAHGSGALQKVALDAMQYDKDDRPSAEEIYDQITSIEESVKLRNQEPRAAEGCC